MASWLSVSMAKRDSCVLPWRWHCLPQLWDQALGRCTIPELQRALLASPPAAKHDRIAARWGSGAFSTSTSVAVLMAPFHKALCPCPSDGAQCSLTQPCPATCQGEGCRGTWITSIWVERRGWHLSLQHPKLPVAEFGNSWGELAKGRFAALSARSGKVTAGKEIQPASCCLQTTSSRTSGNVWPGFAPLQAPFGCASSPSSVDAGMQLCPVLRCARVEWHVLRYPHLPSVGSPSTAPTQGKFGAKEPNTIQWL